MCPELRAVPLKASQRVRCIVPGCGVFHDSRPVLERGGEKRQVSTMRCPTHAQKTLDRGGQVSIERAWEAGLKV